MKTKVNINIVEMEETDSAWFVEARARSQSPFAIVPSIEWVPRSLCFSTSFFLQHFFCFFQFKIDCIFLHLRLFHAPNKITEPGNNHLIGNVHRRHVWESDLERFEWKPSNVANVSLSPENSLGFLYNVFALFAYVCQDNAKKNTRALQLIDTECIAAIRKFFISFFLLISSHFTHSDAATAPFLRHILIQFGKNAIIISRRTRCMLICNCQVGSRKYKSNQRMENTLET